MNHILKKRYRTDIEADRVNKKSKLHYKKMLNTLLLIFIVATLTWYCTRNYQKTHMEENFYGPDSQGDLVLRNLYRRIHNLEAVSRIEIAQNNNHPGGNHNISKERLVMEHIAREIARLKGYARHEIAKRRLPVQHQDKPPLGYDFEDCHYNDCQLKMDHNERILGIPSVPGNTHAYYYNRKYDTLRIPAEEQEAEDIHMV